MGSHDVCVGPGQETLNPALDPVTSQGKFNREHSGVSLEDLDSMEATHRTTLINSLQSLQPRYEDLTSTRAGALNQIRVGNVSAGELENNTAWDELTNWSNYSSDALNVVDAQTTVEGLEQIQVTRDGNVMSDPWVDSSEERSHRLTMFGEPVGRGTPSSAWNTLLTDTGVEANPNTTGMDRLSTQFHGRFMDALPGAARLALRFGIPSRPAGVSSAMSGTLPWVAVTHTPTSTPAMTSGRCSLPRRTPR